MPESFTIDLLPLPAESEILGLVARCPDIEALAYRDGEYLIREDEPSQEIFILLRGALVVEQAPPVPGGAASILACLTADPEAVAIVGEMAYLGAQPRAAAVRSSGRSDTLRLRPGHVDTILESCPGLTRIICRQFSRRLQDTDRSLRDLQARFALNPSRRMAGSGEQLFAQGDPARELFQLVAGSVRLERDGAARVVTAEDLPMGLLEPGPFLRGAAQDASAAVADMAFLAVLGAADRPAVVRCFPELVLALLAEGQGGR